MQNEGAAHILCAFWGLVLTVLRQKSDSAREFMTMVIEDDRMFIERRERSHQMILYHGSNMIVERPRLIRQNRYLDFGYGFYTTTNRDQAVNFAQKVTERRGSGEATLNCYSLDDDVAFEECRLLRFDGPDEAWLDFVAANRQGIYQGEQYDLIYGAVANDNVYRTITLYMTGVLNKEQALSALRIRDLFNQLVFATERSLQYLHYEGSEQV